MMDLFSVERLDWLWRVITAQFLTGFLFMMNLMSLSLPMSDQVRPYFILMAIYYWAIYRPTFISPLAVFFLGLFYDFMADFPVGLHSLLFLIVQWVIRDQRIFLMGQPYMMVWIGFSLTGCFVGVFEWVFFSVSRDHLLSFVPFTSSLLVSVFLFPLISLLFVLAHRILPVANKSLH